MNKIVAITQDSYEQILRDAVSLLKAGELIVVPTETRYGLLVDASNKTALEKLYEAKQRPSLMPTAIFVRSVEEMFQYGKKNDAAVRLAEAYLPGPLTLILEAKVQMQKYVVLNNRIGIRISSSKLIADILAQIDFPVSATSANISGKNDCSSIEEVQDEFGESVSLYIDGGLLDKDASTVVDVSEEELVFHRIGAISQDEIILKVES